MTDYQPMDLNLYYNSGIDNLKGVPSEPALGTQCYHGLPFQIGDNQQNCFITFKPATQPISIMLDDVIIHRLIVAHRLLDSKLMTGDQIGRQIASYLFYYQNGNSVEVPIRERFEISAVPTAWGQNNFNAYPDQEDSLFDRHRGHWGNAGNRQTETSAGSPRDYTLWVWKNPRPKDLVSSMEIIPFDRDFLIAGITLGFLNEDPIARQGRREVMITLSESHEAEKPFGLEVEVDRGLVTYPYPLPNRSIDQDLNSCQKGWGEPQNLQSSPSYVEISATPSATVKIKNHGQELGLVNWGQLEQRKSIQSNKQLQVKIIDGGRNWVHTTVVDSQTNQPIPCRVHFRSINGVPYAPHGHHGHVNSNMGTWHIDVGGDVRLGQLTYAYIDGKCQGWLPRGEVIVDVARGFEYQPLRTKVDIKPNQRKLELRLTRWCDMKAERYFSGDTHVHFLSTQGAHTEAQGEDLDVVNLLLSQWGHLFTNTEEFIGKPSIAHNGKSIVYATQENRQHVLGHLTLLGLKEAVSPWCSGGSNEAEHAGNLETTLSHWADACRAQGGTVILPHIPNPNGEPSTLIATNRIDAVEYLTNAEYGHIEYYRYLNCGYKLPLVGGTDKMSSDVPVGLYRTYVHIPEEEEFNYHNWCKYLKAGNTFLSGGPIIRLSVNGEPIGSTINLKGNGGTIEVSASCQSIFPIYSLEIVKNGEVIDRVEDLNGQKSLTLNCSINCDRHSWVIARCGGPNYPQAISHYDGWSRGIIAHTSPIYIAVGGEWWMFDLETANYMITLAEGSLSYIRNTARHYNPSQTTHHHGEQNHLEFLERPFQEAIQALHQRMHDLGVPH